MNYQQLFERIADREKISKRLAENVVHAVMDEIKTELTKPGKEVRLQNFGTFRSKVRKARKGRNPQTGKLIEIPKKKVVSFKPSISLIQELK